MENSTNNRKEFLRKLGLGIGSLVIPGLSAAQHTSGEPAKLNDGQLAFLVDYQAWLLEFREYVEKRNTNPDNAENNKKLMQLSEIANTRKIKLEEHMKDPIFAAYFNHISQHITDLI